MSILSSFWNLFSSVVQWKLRSWDNLEFTIYLVEIDIYRFQYSNHFEHCLFWFKVLKTKDALKLAIVIPIERSPGITSNTLSCICSWLFRELCFCFCFWTWFVLFVSDMKPLAFVFFTDFLWVVLQMKCFHIICAKCPYFVCILQLKNDGQISWF